jgi:hypothetical protein
MAQAKISIDIRFIPIARFHDDTGMWYPSVKTMIEDRFLSWEEYELPGSYADALEISYELAASKHKMMLDMVGVTYGR